MNDDYDFFIGYVHATDVVDRSLNQGWKADPPGAEQGQVPGLQDNADHQSGNGGGGPRRITQWPITHPLHEHAHKGREKHGNENGQHQDQPIG